MYVKIGPYTNWFGPYQIAELLKYVGVSYKTCINIGKKLNKVKWLVKFCEWIDSKKSRKIKVKIDDYDVWGLDHTLSLIIAPALEKLKEKKHGAPFVDDEDVPGELKSTNAEPRQNEYDTDSNHFRRWDWVLDEMIWSFNEIKNEEWEDKFYQGNIDIQWVPNESGELYTMTNGPNHTHTFDKDGYNEHYNRIKNGLRLFAKYYFGLWD